MMIKRSLCEQYLNDLTHCQTEFSFSPNGTTNVTKLLITNKHLTSQMINTNQPPSGHNTFQSQMKSMLVPESVMEHVQAQ